MNSETEKLLKEIGGNEKIIDDLESKNWDLTVEICKIEGRCPYCRNWHYPHCGDGVSDD